MTKIKILVVDDDEINRMVLGGILESDEYELIYAENGREGVDLYEQRRPDIVLMDVLMPVLDGREAVKRIKQIAGDEFIPVIFLTSISNEDELVECVEAGGDDFLTKPFSKAILEAKIRAFTRSRALSQQVRKHREEMVQEYVFAEKIFARLAKRGILHNSNLNYISTPQSMFNGDLLLAAQRPDKGLNIFVGDATGHGLPAAVGVLPVSDVFYSMTEKGKSAAEIVAAINAKLYQFLPTGLFLCGGFAHFSPDFRWVDIWNGGLPDGFIYDVIEGNIRQLIVSDKIPLGITESQNFSVTRYSLESEDMLYLYTDGVTESENASGKMFGFDGIKACISATPPGMSPFQPISDALRRFRGEKEQSDDVTLIEIYPKALRSVA
ncbi:MAG: fused response regulator/phosphatase [Gammaproteobacteria bacterium]|nr:fused response regulator/phosphatase [Gammaproteobacteria bacterium]